MPGALVLTLAQTREPCVDRAGLCPASAPWPLGGSAQLDLSGALGQGAVSAELPQVEELACVQSLANENHRRGGSLPDGG